SEATRTGLSCRVHECLLGIFHRSIDLHLFLHGQLFNSATGTQGSGIQYHVDFFFHDAGDGVGLRLDLVETAFQSHIDTAHRLGRGISRFHQPVVRADEPNDQDDNDCASDNWDPRYVHGTTFLTKALLVTKAI